MLHPRVQETGAQLLQTTMSNILDPAALISLLPTLLPPDQKVLGSQQAGLAVLIHSALVSVGFRLIAVNDSTEDVSPGNVLPTRWTKNGPNEYAFKYRHDQSSLEFLVKVSQLGKRTLVTAIALEVRVTIRPINCVCTHLACRLTK